MFEGPLPERLALRELVDRYADAVMRRDVDAWAATWAEQAQWCFRDTVINGRNSIVETWEKAMADFQGVVFLCQLGSVKIEDGRATLITHTFEHLTYADGRSRMQTGIYHDEAIHNDAWRFTRRAFTARELTI